ncbi:hypothetical protein F4777DRAFT_90802 [Nemania sp. FL0916]|nr:hypothetical protein F4777DRAFT_90802 [Nemania sp. FL0916]
MRSILLVSSVGSLLCRPLTAIGYASSSDLRPNKVSRAQKISVTFDLSPHAPGTETNLYEAVYRGYTSGKTITETYDNVKEILGALFTTLPEHGDIGKVVNRFRDVMEESITKVNKLIKATETKTRQVQNEFAKIPEAVQAAIKLSTRDGRRVKSDKFQTPRNRNRKTPRQGDWGKPSVSPTMNMDDSPSNCQIEG